MRSRRVLTGCAATMLVVVALAGCTSEAPAPAPSPTPSTPIELTFGAYGADAELAAYSRVVDGWNTAHPDETVTLVPAADRAEQAGRLQAGAAVPDVFLLSRRDLAWALEADLTQPVGDLLDEPDRDVDFGDGYPIDSVRAFSSDNQLQCMPYGYSPMVIYYNTDLVDFAKMERRGLGVPSKPGSWSFDEFSDAARFASRPGKRTSGVYIEPSLDGLAPFVYSGGGKLFDATDNPTSLALSDGATQSALATTLTLLRNPLVTLPDARLESRSPVEWFKAGKLGMIAGYRSLTPELRGISGLNFDVMEMPRLSDSRTIGEVSGLCMSKDTVDSDAAADFIYYLSSPEAVSQVAQAGYLVPASVEVAASDAFLQPGRMPLTSEVFNNSIRDIVLPPLVDSYARLDETVATDVGRLFSVALLDAQTLDALTTSIDTDSQAVLAPESISPSPSESTSESTSESAGDAASPSVSP